MPSLTPYDKGEVLEPIVWLDPKSPYLGITDAADFGKVDFENDESATICTIQIVRNDPRGTCGWCDGGSLIVNLGYAPDGSWLGERAEPCPQCDGSGQTGAFTIRIDGVRTDFEIEWRD